MKQLICAKDVEILKKEGRTEYCIREGAIITSSTRDAADSFGITFSYKKESDGGNAPSISRDIGSGQVHMMLKALMDKGLLNKGFLDGTLDSYDSQRHPSGLRAVRGDLVEVDMFDTGDPEAKAYFQELVSKEESHISADSLMIDHSDFQWRLIYGGIDYMIEGTLTVAVDGTTYYAHIGDVLLVPSGSKVVWESPDRARISYATYPANWTDLV